MSFISLMRTIGFKLESPAYASTTVLSATDYNIPAFNINYDPSIALEARKIARGDLSKDVSIAGKRSIKITFDIAVAYSGTGTVAPSYFKVLQACAMKQTTPSSNVVLTTDATMTKTPAAIEIQEKEEGATPSAVLIKARGCMGNAKLALNNVGEVVKISFDFMGVLESITDRANASLLVPTGFDSPLPDAVLSASIKVFTEAQTLNKVTIDLGNKVELYTDPSKSEGYQGAHVVERNPTMETDQDLELIATRGDYARFTGNTTGAFTMDVGSHIILTAPAVQIIKAYAPGEREGHVTNNHSYEMKRGASGNDDFVITHS